ncbi:MAG: hypothetical protein Q9214_002464, partial [Letrouitia sp. 1 TL-2023]
LHVWMGLNEEDIAQDDADEKQSCTDKIGKKVRESGEDASGGKDGGHGSSRACKKSTDSGAYDSPNGPNKGHYR